MDNKTLSVPVRFDKFIGIATADCSDQSKNIDYLSANHMVDVKEKLVFGYHIRFGEKRAGSSKSNRVYLSFLCSAVILNSIAIASFAKDTTLDPPAEGEITITSQGDYRVVPSTKPFDPRIPFNQADNWRKGFGARASAIKQISDFFANKALEIQIAEKVSELEPAIKEELTNRPAGKMGSLVKVSVSYWPSTGQRVLRGVLFVASGSFEDAVYGLNSPTPSLSPSFLQGTLPDESASSWIWFQMTPQGTLASKAISNAEMDITRFRLYDQDLREDRDEKQQQLNDSRTYYLDKIDKLNDWGKSWRDYAENEKTNSEALRLRAVQNIQDLIKHANASQAETAEWKRYGNALKAKIGEYQTYSQSLRDQNAALLKELAQLRASNSSSSNQTTSTMSTGSASSGDLRSLHEPTFVGSTHLPAEVPKKAPKAEVPKAEAPHAQTPPPREPPAKEPKEKPKKEPKERPARPEPTVTHTILL